MEVWTEHAENKHGVQLELDKAEKDTSWCFNLRSYIKEEITGLNWTLFFEAIIRKCPH